VDITTTLTDTTHNTPIDNKSATITVNGQIYTANTDNFGQITWNYLINNMATQDYNIAVSFTGDTQHAASTGTGTLTVNLIPITITIENVRGNKDETVTLSAVLVDHHDNPLNGKTMEFWIDSLYILGWTTGLNLYIQCIKSIRNLQHKQHRS